MFAIGYGCLMALCFAAVFGLLSTVRSKTENSIGTAAGTAIVSFILIAILDTCLFYFQQPATTMAGMIHVVFFDLLIALVVTGVGDFIAEDVGAAVVVAVIAFVITGITWVAGYNSGHDANKATNIVKVTQEPKDDLPASTTTNMVILSPGMAKTKASQAMSSGIAGQRNYNTYLNLGPATLEYVDGHMTYVFPLHFDGSGNKHRLNNIEPGYIMISAEDNNANPIERYDNQYNMKICQDCGQQSEPARYAYTHGYSSYKLDTPVLEVDDQGNPYWTIALLKPHLGWTFYAPSKLLLINAHTGAMQTYALGNEPEWVDRVYGESMAKQIVNWYGTYKAGFKGINSSNANRYKVSGDPILVYTGDGHPDWRMLLTSMNSDASTYKIVNMDSRTGAVRMYTPSSAMAIESHAVDAFNSASGVGSNNVKANRYTAVGLTLHIIYGHLTWMATYEPEGSSQSFVGLGFVDAYHVSANNVAFGTSRETALSNYLTQLATEPTSNGNAPEQGLQTSTVSGTVGQVNWDVISGQKFWYITLTSDQSYAYQATETSVGPALVFVQPGDKVTMTYQNTGSTESTRTMLSFTDTRVPLKKPGS